MKATTYILTPKMESAIVSTALHTISSALRDEGITVENSNDHTWQSSSLELLPKYNQLDTKDIAYLIESKIVEVLETLLWGHRFRVYANVSKYPHEEGIHLVHIYIETLQM